MDETLVECPRCGAMLDVAYDWNRLAPPKRPKQFESERAERDLAPPEKIVTIGEGQTLFAPSDAVARYVGLRPGRLFLQYEGMNPSGSFKDNGMTAAFTHANVVGATRAACASTGNTSASLAMYAAATGRMRAIVFIGSGKIAYGKLAQALDFGAVTLQIDGDFDDAMRQVRQVARELGIYLVNSVNPFRLERQKTTMYRILEGLHWEAPDWIVVPGGNLGNSAAFGKAFAELMHLGLIDRAPRMAVINAAGANSLYEMYEHRGLRWNDGRVVRNAISDFFTELDASGRRASTVASAIEINHPVNLDKCLRALDITDGTVRQVTDEEIMDAKARVGAGGLGCEPASAAAVAGARRLRSEGVIGEDDRVVAILTGHQLKDPTATVAYHADDNAQFDRVLGMHGVERVQFPNRAVAAPNDLDEIVRLLDSSFAGRS